jgi:hypothetical protein
MKTQLPLRRFKSKLSLFIGFLLCSVNLFAGQITLLWEPNVDSDLGGYKLYSSTNSFVTTTVTNVGNVTQKDCFVVNGVLYSFYATAYDTNGIESDPSNMLKYYRRTVVIGRTNVVQLMGDMNWVGAELVVSPTNGVLSGTPPNLFYFTFSTNAGGMDKFTYKIADIFHGQNITNYYSVHFLRVIGPPVVRANVAN